MLGTSAIIRLAEDGSIILNTGAVDIGQGADTVLAQICADRSRSMSVVSMWWLRIPTPPHTTVARVPAALPIWRGVLWSAPQRRSRIKYSCTRQRCWNAASRTLSSATAGLFEFKGTDKRVSFFEISLRAHYGLGGPIIGENAFVYDGEPFDPKRCTMVGFPFSNFGIYMFGVQVVEVEVDDDTGQIVPVAAWLGHDVGRAINPSAVEGQIQGGFVQGLGYALWEELIWDNGRLSNPTMMDYKIPSTLDVPLAIEPIIVEEHEASGPFGAKEVGEPGIIAAAPAVANAVAAATGVRVRQIPLTPERVFRALTRG